MRDPKRIEDVLFELKYYWKRHPDMRLGQILDNLAKNLAKIKKGSEDVFYLEDETLFKWLLKENQSNTRDAIEASKSKST